MRHNQKTVAPSVDQRRGLSLVDWAVPVTILALCVVITWFSLQMDKAPEIMVGHSMQPRAFPIFLMALIVVLTGVMTVQTLKKGSEKRKPIEWQTWTTAGFFGVFTVIALTLDMFLGLIVVMFAISYSYGEKRIWAALAVSILTPLIIFFAFDLGLGVRFPRGLLTELYY